ncbi:MAG: tripartite tricarboxylate transporter substrate binding protein [Betaproteobacteria bacterium]|nr:tripartite tricarboxylate transporter substrate binding protein [Betaproteobacteria bacterium]
MAQSAWPTKPIRMVIAFPPGGPTDIVSRIIAAELGRLLGQQVVVENKPGAGGNLGAEQVARAAADGYTIFYNTSAITIAPALYGKLTYDPQKDFVAVGLAATVPLVLVINPEVPAKNPREFVAWARTRKGQVNYGSSGSGTITHLAAAQLAKDAGFTATHVPYKGSAPGMLDLASGQVQFMVDTINSTLPMIRDGRLRALAVATSKRSSVLPELPTIAESLIAGFEMSAWQGIVVPSGTPPAIITRLNSELQKVLASAEVRGKLLATGTEILGGTPEQYSQYIQSELKRFAQLAREAGARID